MAPQELFHCLIWILALATLPILAVSFSPNVTIVSCTSRRLVVEISDAANDGIVYIQGRSTYCKRFTSSEKTIHAFDFDMCDLKYDSKFRLVIQRHPDYQTGHDKVIPIMCLVDMSDIYVSGVMFPEEILDESAVNKTVKPIINMDILTENETSPIQEVTLNDKVKLKLRLDQEYIGIFDIKASDCVAAFIPILENECSTDEELFPNFVRTTQGEIISTFNAFKPTNLPGDVDLDIGFTCTVSVCKGACDQTVCGEIIGWGRRRRDAAGVKDKVVENVTVGTSLKVKAPRLPGTVASLRSEYCAEKTVVTAVSGIVIVVLVFSWMICGCALCRLTSRSDKLPSESRIPNAMRRLSEINVNFAKSVGRRLSTMLNIPTGYEVNDQRLRGGDNDCDTPPSKRRDSVTVSYEGDYYLRKRLVSSSTQTQSISSFSREGSVGDDDVFSVNSESSSRRLSNPITSISISSSASKSNAHTNASRYTGLPRQNSEIISSQKIRPFPLRNRSATIGNYTENDSGVLSHDEPIIDYDVDDIPIARKPYAAVIQVRNANGSKSDASQGTSTDAVDGRVPTTAILYNDLTKDSDITDDVFAAPSEPNMIDRPSDRKIFDQIPKSDGYINTGFDDIDMKRSKFDTAELKSRVEMRKMSSDMDVADDVYEVIEIGAQIKRERKYSTHV